MDSITKFEKTLAACLLTPLADPSDPLTQWGITANFIGDSGAGKSAGVNTIAKHVGLPCFPIYSATKTPEHIGGFPANTAEGFMLRCALPQVLYAMDAQRAVIFLDEISTAPEAVQAALLSFVNERTVGEYTLPVGVRIVMAMNPPDVAANGHDLTIPMANRIAHFPFTPWTIDQFEDFKLGRYTPSVFNLQHGEALIRKNWNDHYAHVVTTTFDFLRADNGEVIVGKDESGAPIKRSKLDDQPEPSDPRASGPWPSRRVWDWAMNGVTAVRCLGFEPSLETDLVAALVGKGIASEWATFIRKQDLPQPFDVLSKGLPVPKRMDVARATMNACAAYVVHIQDEDQKAAMAVACWKMLGDAITNSGYSDLTVKPAQQLIHAGLDVSHSNENVADASEEVCNVLHKSGQLKYLK